MGADLTGKKRVKKGKKRKMRYVILSICIAIFSAMIMAQTPVAVAVETDRIVEGQNVRATILRGDMEGDLTVNYRVGAPKIEIANIITSSSNNYLLSRLIDGDNKSSWCNDGNAKYSGKDDEPYFIFVLKEPTVVSQISLINYVNPGHEFRGIKEVVIETSADGQTFDEVDNIVVSPTRYGVTEGVFETFTLPRTEWDKKIVAIKLKVLSNYNRAFYKGTSYEGDHANGSAMGLSEVEIYATGINKETLNHNNTSITIPAGQASVSFNIATVNDQFIVGDRVMEIAILPSKEYTLDPVHKAYVLVLDNDRGPKVSVSAEQDTADFDRGEVGKIVFKRDNNEGDLLVRYTTANKLVPIQFSSASSSHYSAPPSNMHDNSLATNWGNTGNAKYETEEDDEPWVAFTFDDVYTLGLMRVANYINPGHTFRSLKDVEVLVSLDENNLESVGFMTLRRSADSEKLATFEDIPLVGITARRVAFKILSNYACEFYKGTSYEGDYANGSAVGLAEVQFYTGSTLSFTDIEEKIENYVIIPNGQYETTLTITPKRIVDGKYITVTLLEDYTKYTVDFNMMETTVNVK